MKGESQADHRYHLLRYFLITTIVAMLAAMVVVPVLVYRHGTVDELSRTTADHAEMGRILANGLRHHLWTGVPPAAEVERIVGEATAGLSPIAIRIRKPDGTLALASPAFLGGPSVTAEAMGAAASASNTITTVLARKGTDAIALALSPDRDWVVSHIPASVAGATAPWVIETALDATDGIAEIDRSTWHLIVSLALSLAAAYAMVAMIVVRADRTLNRQYRDLKSVGDSLEAQNLLLSREVADRRKAEEALLVAEGRKAFILESAMEAIITVDDRRQTVEYNHAARDIFGYDREEVLARDIADLIIPEARKGAHSAAFQHFVDTGKGKSGGRPFRVTAHRKDGNEFPLQIAITSFALGERRYFTAVMQDMTERLEAEKLRDEAERALLDVIEASPVAVGITDNSGRLLYWNTVFFQMGRHFIDEKGNNSFGLVFASPGLHRSLLARMENGERIWNDEAELVLGNDTNAWVLVSMQSMVFERNPAVLTWLYDVTDLKRQEQALTDARNDAEKASRAKSDFLATMSHEIRTPMNGVVTVSEILDQTELTDGQRAMSTIIRDSAAALMAIIDDVLDFSKIEAGRLAIEQASLSLAQIVEGVADLLGPRAAEKGLELIAYLDPATPDHLVGDVVRIRQVLLNLVGNAVKFTEHGHVAIEVTLTGLDDGLAEVMFRVVDTGIGISPEQHTQLFRPFMQADTSTVRRFGGTGLGLSICKTLVELMGGTIGLDSTPGEGSTFSFRLSLPVKEERRLPVDSDLAGIRVLVATPRPPQARVMTAYLAHGGAKVVVADTGGDVIKLLRAAAGAGEPFEVVVTDSDFPDMSGLGLAQAVAGDAASGRPRLVLMVPKMAAFAFMTTHHDVLFATVSKPARRASLCNVVSAAAGRVELRDMTVPSRRRDDHGHKQYIPPSVDEALVSGNLILVAEDNPTNQTVIRMLLERLGYAAEVACNGIEAWRMLQERPYGLLLTDCHMPEADGYQLTRMVRERERGTDTHLPIVALTADAVAGTAQKCADAGMDSYLKKPVTWEELDNAIEKWLPGAAALRQTAPSAATERIDPPAKVAPAPTVESTQEPAASTVTPAAVVLDPAYLLDLLGGDTDMLRPMLDQFVETTRPLVEELLEALKVEEYETVRKKAHSCSGASKTAGAMEFAGICGTIERAVVAKDHDSVRKAGADVSESFEKVVVAVSKV